MTSRNSSDVFCWWREEQGGDHASEGDRSSVVYSVSTSARIRVRIKMMDTKDGTHVDSGFENKLKV